MIGMEVGVLVQSGAETETIRCVGAAHQRRNSSAARAWARRVCRLRMLREEFEEAIKALSPAASTSAGTVIMARAMGNGVFILGSEALLYFPLYKCVLRS